MGVKEYNDQHAMIRTLPVTLCLSIPKPRAEKHTFSRSLACFSDFLLEKAASLEEPAEVRPVKSERRKLKREASAAEEERPEGVPLIVVPDLMGPHVDVARADSDEEDELHTCESLNRKIVSRRNMVFLTKHGLQVQKSAQESVGMGLFAGKQLRKDSAFPCKGPGPQYPTHTSCMPGSFAFQSFGNSTFK